MQRHSFVVVANDTCHHVRISSGEAGCDSACSGAGFSADCGGGERTAHCGNRTAGAVLGPGKSRGVLSCLFGMAHLCSVADDAFCAAPGAQPLPPRQRGSSMRLKWRFWVAAALLAGTVLLLYARNSSEIIPARQPLASFPRTLRSWTTSGDIPLSPEILQILGPGDFLLRDYQDPAGAA